MSDGWDIGPDIAKLTLRAVPGLPVTWPLTPIPDDWTPVQPVFEVRMGDGTVTSYPLTRTAMEGEPESVWLTVLTAEQTSALDGRGRARLIDSGQVIAAGPFRRLSGWSANVTPVSMPARILAGPPGTGGDGSGGSGYTRAQIEEFARDAVGAALTPGDDIAIAPNDLANTITVSVAEIQSLALLYQGART